MKALMNIQTELKAPKEHLNKFGGYKYRNCEDILEAVKPLLKKHGAFLTISDEIAVFLDRVYVQSTATLYADGETISVKAYARETQNKKGMDEAQLTGATSSYARKYALNGLFAIDDTKDIDSQEMPQPQQKKQSDKKIAWDRFVANCQSFGVEAKGFLEFLNIPDKQTLQKIDYLNNNYRSLRDEIEKYKGRQICN